MRIACVNVDFLDVIAVFRVIENVDELLRIVRVQGRGLGSVARAYSTPVRVKRDCFKQRALRKMVEEAVGKPEVAQVCLAGHLGHNFCEDLGRQHAAGGRGHVDGA
jgi:hypothetical protein